MTGPVFILALIIALLLGGIWGCAAWGASKGCPFCLGMLWMRK